MCGSASFGGPSCAAKWWNSGVIRLFLGEKVVKNNSARCELTSFLGRFRGGQSD